MTQFNDQKDVIAFMVNGVQVQAGAVQNFFIIEGTSLPFPYCMACLVASKEMNYQGNVFIGGRVTIILRTGTGDGTDTQMEFQIVQAREIPTQNDLTTIAFCAVMANASNLFSINRRAFVNMTSKDSLIALYEDDVTFDEVTDDCGDDVAFADKMTWLQTGTWVGLWVQLLSRSYLGDSDTLLAFANIDGEAVVTTLNTIFSEKNPLPIILGSYSQSDFHRSYQDDMLFYHFLRDSNIDLIGGIAVSAIHTLDLDANELDYLSTTGVDAYGVKDMGQSIPMGAHLMDGTLSTEMGFLSKNVHANWAKAGVQNSNIGGVFNGNIIQVSMPMHPNLRIGELIDLQMPDVGTGHGSKHRYSGHWLVKRIMWDFDDAGVVAHATLARPSMQSTEYDEKASK